MRGWNRVLLTAVLAATLTPAMAAPNWVGQTGNIVTPNDVIVNPGEFSAGYHFLDKEAFGGGDDMHIFSVGYGFTPAFEGSLSYVSRDDDELLLNAKYRLVAERAGTPSVTVGVVDLLDELEQDPGLYIIFGKTLTPLTGAVTRPLHGYLGIGTGTYDGIIAGLDYVATPQLTLMLEFSPEGPLTGRDDTFNIGARYALSRGVRIGAALIDFDNFGLGISFTSGVGRR